MNYLSGKQLKAISSLASKDKGRPSLGCIWFDSTPQVKSPHYPHRLEDGHLRLTATDGHQLFQLIFPGSQCGKFEPFAYSLDTIKRLMPTDKIKVSSSGLEFDGQSIGCIVDKLSMPCWDDVVPKHVSETKELQNYFGIGFGIINRASKAVLAVSGCKDQSVRFQIGKDYLSPVRYDFTPEDMDGNLIEAIGVIMPVRIDLAESKARKAA